MALDLGNLLQQYLGGRARSGQEADDFEQVARTAPQTDIASAIANALRSDQTPPFGQIIGQLFGQASPNQRADMLNSLLKGGGGALLSRFAAGGLGKLFGGAVPDTISPEQAANIAPEQVEAIAQEAERENPGIVDHLSNFYAEHPALIKAAGGAALAVALGHIAQNLRAPSSKED